MSQLLDALPLWAVFAATAILVLLSFVGGRRLGVSRRDGPAPESAATVASIVNATSSLLSFLLAFTFGLSASRFDARKQLLVDEANAIETAYLRTDLLPDPQRSELRRFLRQYVELRLDDVRLERESRSVQKSGELHRQLWSQAVAAEAASVRPTTAGLFIQALGDVFDLHSKRVTAIGIPGVIWSVLYLVAVLALAGMGYQAGLSGGGGSRAVIALVLAYSLVLFLIADLDRPDEGTLTVSRHVMIDLRNTMQGSMP